jgi:protein-S-isoprenylcysteine O-methyltransferase Ste14
MALQEEIEKQGNWLFKYRGVLPLIILAIGGYLYVQPELHHELWALEETSYEKYYEFGCLLVSFLGFAIRIFTVGYTPENTSGRNTGEQLADQLNTKGIYSIVRHPLYLGNFFMWLGIALLTVNLWFIIAFVFLYVIYYERIMFAEEQFLRRKFGEIYLEWAARTPSVLPRFKNYEKPPFNFSWKKVLKQEKNGLAAVFCIFFLFNFLGEWLQHTYNYSRFYMFGCIISLVLYFILKYLKRNTTLLNETGR